MPDSFRASVIVNKSLFVSFLVLIISLSLAILGTILDSPPLSLAIISFIIFVLYSVYLLFYESSFFILLFMHLFGYFGSLLGGVFVESGTFVLEQVRFGYATGSTTRLLFLAILHITIMHIVYSVLCKRILRKITIRTMRLPLSMIIGIVFLSTSLLIYLLSICYLHGNVYTLGIDRFEYYKYIIPAGTLYLLGLSAQLILLNGILFLYLSQHRARFIVLSIFFLQLFTQILYGDKFSGLFATTYLFFLPTILKYSLEIRQRLSFRAILKIVLPIMVFVGISGALILGQYQQIYVGDPFELLKLRIAGQGHVWWGVDEIVKNGRSHRDAQDQLYKEIFTKPPPIEGESSERGLNFLMELVSPYAVINIYFERGARFTMGYPAIGLYLFGYLGVTIFELLTSSIFIILLVYSAAKILKGQLLCAFISLRVILIPLGDVFLMGEFYRLFRVEVFVYIILLILLEGFAFMKNRISFCNQSIQ